MPNRLARATSPYLQQHAGNPVDWHEWGPEALERARREDRPIHLSVGYAACHWCHVMAHESFEDEAVAGFLNASFVNVKVDREERPDIDGLYMQAVQAMTGRGGWPMTVFLRPDGVPFFAGTYFPPEDRHGLPAFRRVAEAVAAAWRDRRADLDATAERLADLYRAMEAPPAGAGPAPGPALLQAACEGLARRFDRAHAGFGGAPKFPPSMALSFLLTHWARTGAQPALEMAHGTFLAMARGGVFDQLGGGLHRYSVDERWLVPHFEKMLYDNALFVRLGTELWQATADPAVREAVTATLDWVAREMTLPGGGFAASLDADSEGAEGTFYVWEADAFRRAAGVDAELAAAHWGVTPGGNFEGRSVLHVAADAGRLAGPGGDPADVAARLARARAALLAARARRPRPARDDKVVAAWNGLMLRAVAAAARAFDRPDWAALAAASAGFLAEQMVRGRRVRRAWRDGRLRPEGFLEDQAAVALGFLEVHALTGDGTWLDRALALADELVARFADARGAGFFDTPDDHEPLVSRPRDPTDNATPSGASLATELLLRVGELTGDPGPARRAEAALAALAPSMQEHPLAFGHALQAADLVAHGAVQLVVAGAGNDPGTAALARAAAAEYVPSPVVLRVDPARPPGLALARDKGLVEGRPAAWVCRRYVCERPVTVPGDLGPVLRAARRAGG